MNLIDALQQINEEGRRGAQLTDLKIGTVVALKPLEITINSQMAPIRESIIYLTAAVVERKIPVLAHTHTVSGLSHSHTATEGSIGSALGGTYPTSAALDGLACIEDGQQLPVENGYIILNRGLVVGDRVLILRVMSGQKFIVLSRIFGGAGDGDATG